MKLNLKDLQKEELWQAAGIQLPQFNIDAVKEKTLQAPSWIHFGAGNIFRAFIARIHQELLDKNEVDKGIIAVETFDFEVIDKIYKPYDNLALTVLMDNQGNFDKTVVASVVHSMTTKSDNGDLESLRSFFTKKELQIVSFTITEKGYTLKNLQGEFFPFVQQDLEKGPDHAVHAMSVATALLFHRFQNGAFPLAMVSMDNFSHNGDTLKNAILTIAEAWEEAGFVPKDFLEYLRNNKKVSFPYSMIDKITPRPDDDVKKILEDLGLEDIAGVVTSKNTYIAPYVNAEISEYLVVEDNFPNGRPPLQEIGVYFTDKETVNNVETMKVTTCLNPLHTALAVTGCVLGFTSIWEEMKDPVLYELVRRVGYDEGLPVVLDPGILSPKDFIDEVLNKRFSNPYIPDTPQRIASDTSLKMAIRFGETIKAYMKSEDRNPSDLLGIPLVIAAWCRYLLAIDDDGKPFELSPDPRLEKLIPLVNGISLGVSSANIKPILSDETVFGCDLYKEGIGQRAEAFFQEMIAGQGALRKTLEKYLL